jgi:uncharacterized protein (TIGR00369 family)
MLPAFLALVGQPLTNSPSATGRWLAGTLIAAEEGALSVEYVVRPEMTNPAGTLHGGIIATMMDDVIGMSVMSLGRADFYASINIHVDYLNSARPGDILVARARVVRAGRNVVNAECSLSDQRDRLVARAVSNLGRVDVSPRSS